jgi:hypothetical protein
MALLPNGRNECSNGAFYLDPARLHFRAINKISVSEAGLDRPLVASSWSRRVPGLSITSLCLSRKLNLMSSPVWGVKFERPAP